MKNKVIPNPKNWHEMNVMAFKYHLGHDIRIEVNMGKEEILNHIKQGLPYMNSEEKNES